MRAHVGIRHGHKAHEHMTYGMTSVSKSSTVKGVSKYDIKAFKTNLNGI